MREFKPREITRFTMADGELLAHCRNLVRNREYNVKSFYDELYNIVRAVMAKMGFGILHSDAVRDEVTQDCITKFCWYTIPKIVASANFVKSINCHSYLFQNAYFTVLQYINAEKRMKKYKPDVEALNELLGEMVFADGHRTVAKPKQTMEDRVLEKVGQK